MSGTAATSAELRVAINACSIGGNMTGIGHHTANLLHGLARRHNGQHYLAFRSSGAPPAPWSTAPHISDLQFEGADPMWEQLALPTLLEEHQADVYHNPAFGLPVVKTTRLVCTVHDCIPRLFPQYAPPSLRDFFQRWAPSWMKLADHIICVSEHTKHDIMHLYGADPDRISVVYQAANEALQPVTQPLRIEAAKARYGIDRPYILNVGRVELRKNVGGLLEAFRIVQGRSREPLLLVLVGPRDEVPYDPQGILPPPGRSGDVVAPGYVADDELAALYSGCEAFCFPSFYEGFGIPVLEAMQCGAPVITSRVSSLPEVGGDACLHVNPYDPGEIAEALLRVIEDREARNEMRERGFARARGFSLERFAGGVAEAYRRAAEGT